MSRSARLPSVDYGLPDLLPSFATLTTDEERERKAQSSIPGTYNVIIMPESFSYLPGHADERSGEQCRSSTPSSLIDSGLSSHNPEVNDPNVVILKTFPDARRYLCSDYRGYTQTLGSDPRDFPYPSTVSVYSADSSTLDDYNAQAQTKLIDYEAMLLSHFRNVVWPKLVPQGICSDGHRLGVEVLEQEAAICPPLFQAMMALSKLGLERQGSCVGMGAMNPPRQDFPLPQDIFHHSDNLLSDGLFLTQFLLLIHEAMAAKSDGPSLWSHHISRMLEITFLRQSAFGVERFPFVIWWICNIDLYALLSGAGTGAYVKTVLESDLLPWPGSLLSPIGPHGSDVIYSHEPDNLTLLLQLYMDMFGLAVQLGLTIADMKKLGASYPYSPINLHEDFSRLWDSSDVRFWAENQTRLPKQLQNIFEQINLLFHTSLLLYYTSMCPSQSIGLGEIPAQIVHHHTTMIFQHAEAMMVRIQGSPPHFIIFPLFLAGIAAETIDLKVKAWELLSNLEENEIGYNASTTCSMLQLVYEYQMQRSSGNSSSRAFPWIDWVELLAERGFRLVSYG
ncbi:hypothetical protein BDV40DRAFT_299691 [Aspergillus tamarii]|uniref:Fungal-specific transcription factor domain-containing protein n=1 Tax=Aspergillus tamarii TaxID=41984 RepID=A0A5N6UWW6_ASPTM|nr:hypothetical protein BDV40DRAFT_299691 [Aspergillus tamarii]